MCVPAYSNRDWIYQFIQSYHTANHIPINSFNHTCMPSHSIPIWFNHHMIVWTHSINPPSYIRYPGPFGAVWSRFWWGVTSGVHNIAFEFSCGIWASSCSGIIRTLKTKRFQFSKSKSDFFWCQKRQKNVPSWTSEQFSQLASPAAKTTAPRIPAWSPTVVLTRRHSG